jgi:hypothetical protein
MVAETHENNWVPYRDRGGRGYPSNVVRRPPDITKSSKLEGAMAGVELGEF